MNVGNYPRKFFFWTFIVQCLLLGIKLSGSKLSWWIVLSPLWVAPILYVVLAIVVLVVLALLKKYY